MSIHVYSEVERLEQVVVHRPGPEISAMTQYELDHLLFDDILSPDVAAQEHELLTEILASEGAHVLEIADLLRRALRAAPEGEVRGLVRRVCDRAGHHALVPSLLELGHDALAKALIEGIQWRALQGPAETLARLFDSGSGRNAWALRPVPNLMFTRDPCIAVYDRVLRSRMATDAREREPLIAHFALQHGLGERPSFAFDDDDWERHRAFRRLEGGDLLVLSPSFLMIGCSERTTAQTIQRVAETVLQPAFPHLQRVYAVGMPALRSVMHLDTILTQIDRDLFLGHEPMISGGHGIEVACLEKGRPPRLLERATVADVLRDELGATVQIVPCGGSDPVHQQREQWTDGANAVCIAPGRIVLYARNVRTTAALCDRHGYREVRLSVTHDSATRTHRLAAARRHDRVVYTFSGSELSRARGGARCMTMPLGRGARGAAG